MVAALDPGREKCEWKYLLLPFQHYGFPVEGIVA
jgi:hypothetical protein